MGFLDVGTPLPWTESLAVLAYVKRHGIEQLLHLWRTNRERKDEALRWGEEVEYTLVDINSGKYHSRIYSDAADILEELSVREHFRPRPTVHLSSQWHPEFGNHMVEAIPSPPYPLNLNSLLMLEPSMRLRRAKIQSILPDNKFVTSQAAFPRLGLGDFVDPPPPPLDPDTSVTHSVFIPDELINPHPRFPTLVGNIRARRGANPFIKIPVFKDTLTGAVSGRQSRCQATHDSAEADWSLAQDVKTLDRFAVERLARKTINPVKDYIYMDCFAFGMGMSCVQTTFACPDISTARYLYDQLTVLAPLFLALTASTPFQRGLLSDYDTRWSTLEQAVDCRTESELLTTPKSRYSGVSLYISDREALALHEDEYNNTRPPLNDAVYTTLREAGMDHLLAQHFAHLWIRDPMVIFAEKIKLDDTRAVDHFENIQSTNWNSVRFKPPPPSSDPEKLSPIGWRVEFRTPEAQLTDFDNAAGVALISVLAQVILSQNLDLYIPMSMNDINMTRSWQRDAITEQKFYFRRNLDSGTTDRSVVEMTLYEILAGCPEKGFRGLVPICEEFMAGNKILPRCVGGVTTSFPVCGADTRRRFSQYVSLYLDRASGKKMTCAQFLREFVRRHPDYAQDSVITPMISHDLTVLSANMGFGVWVAPKMYRESVSRLILQTPLPASTELPAFSPQGASIITFVDIDDSTDQRFEEKGHSTSSPLVLYKKPVIALNAIDSIYTMPVGVTARFGQRRHLVDTLGGSDLFHMTFDALVGHSLLAPGNCSLLRRNTMSLPALSEAEGLTNGDPNSNEASTPSTTALTPDSAEEASPASESPLQHHQLCYALMQQPIPTLHGLVSSEDFTQAWILKGFDCVGGPDNIKCCNGFAKQKLLLCHSKTDDSRKLCSSRSPGDPKRRGLDGDRMSTACPSSAEGTCERECEIDGDVIHELSRSLSLGFDTEQELEYFQQVCHASA